MMYSLTPSQRDCSVGADCEAADNNGDGTVSEKERAAYQQTTAYLNKHPDAGSAKGDAANAAYAQGAASFVRAPASATRCC